MGTTASPPATALIAEDEPLLAQALRAELARAWPELRLLEIVGDGLSVVQRALALRPSVLFLDIQMPGQTGLDAAAELAECWPEGEAPFPLLVFVTAYDQYAVQAFDAQAVDYLVKPVQSVRLERTVARLRERLVRVQTPQDSLQAAMEQLRALLPAATTGAATAPRLRQIQASVGTSVHLVPLEEVLYFEAADKYVRVLTRSGEHLIRTPIKDLLPQLDPQEFWQVHRSVLVRASEIARVQRDQAGRLSLALRSRPEVLPVSRLYAHLFRAM